MSGWTKVVGIYGIGQLTEGVVWMHIQRVGIIDWNKIKLHRAWLV